jgi:polyhydroxyalkanoate synthesis regulator protein
MTKPENIKWRAGWEKGCYIILKYANRRLYDVQVKEYCTNIDVMNRIKDGKKVRVYSDAGDTDITRQVLFAVLAKVEELVELAAHHQVQISVDKLQKYIHAGAANVPPKTIPTKIPQAA